MWAHSLSRHPFEPKVEFPLQLLVPGRLSEALFGRVHKDGDGVVGPLPHLGIETFPEPGGGLAARPAEIESEIGQRFERFREEPGKSGIHVAERLLR